MKFKELFDEFILRTKIVETGEYPPVIESQKSKELILYFKRGYLLYKLFHKGMDTSVEIEDIDKLFIIK
jgi:hypothetical protein